MKLSTRLILGSFICVNMGVAQAALSAAEVKSLGSTLTLTGAEKEGNKDGSIPAYTGGLTKAPANYKAGSGVRPDPFADEKPLFSIDAKNMNNYADKLTEGTKGMMKKHSSFRVDVYPTHRTVAFPKYVIENTVKNAGKAKTLNDGLSVDGADGQIPFPIPKDGYEAMWNHLLRFNGQAYAMKYRNFNVDSSGRPTMAVEARMDVEYPYWNPGKGDAETYFKAKINFTGPARRAGEAILMVDPLDSLKGRRAWQYLPGQRRVKLAPAISFDTPNSGTAGVQTWDDAWLFNGSMERYAWKLIGKKEMYVPYNAYKAVYESEPDQLVTPKHLNPSLVRWELHRVWIVEATLREGKRHVYAKRRFYLDEDSWAAVAAESYDSRGELYKANFALQSPSYDLPSSYTDPAVYYDLISGAYALQGVITKDGFHRYTEPLPQSGWSPDSLAGSGIR